MTFWPEPFKRGSDNAPANDNCRNDTCKLGHHNILTDDRVQIDCYSVLPEQPAFFVFSHHCQPIDRRGHHQEHISKGGAYDDIQDVKEEDAGETDDWGELGL